MRFYQVILLGGLLGGSLVAVQWLRGSDSAGAAGKNCGAAGGCPGSVCLFDGDETPETSTANNPEGAAMSCCPHESGGSTPTAGPLPAAGPTARTEAEWKKLLTPEQYRVMRQHGTERPFSGKYYKVDAEGAYHCAACEAVLFHSEAKYDSGSGWPSFFQPAAEDNLVTRRDTSQGMVRTEVLCKSCGSHLGHVFNDGPQPTGLRYCINSVCLDLKPKAQPGKEAESPPDPPAEP